MAKLPSRNRSQKIGSYFTFLQRILRTVGGLIQKLALSAPLGLPEQ